MAFLACLIVLLFYMFNCPYGHVKNSMKETSTNFGVVLMFEVSGPRTEFLCITDHGQEAEDSFPTKFCSFPRWFSYDDDCSCL